MKEATVRENVNVTRKRKIVHALGKEISSEYLKDVTVILRNSVVSHFTCRM